MANEFKHKDPCATLTSCEYIGADGTGHVFASQATGDLLYADSATVLNRLARACSGSQMLQIASCKPAWTATPSLGTTSWCNMNHAHGAANSGGTVCANVLAGTTLKSTVVNSSLENVGTLTALQVDYINANASTVTITDSSDTGDLASLAVTTHGATTLTTTDDDAAAAHFTVDADGNITLDSATGIVTIEDGGTEVLRFTESCSGDVTIKLVTNAKDLIFTDNGDAEGFRILDAAAGVNVAGLLTAGSLDIDNVLINGTTIGHTCDTDLMTVGNAALTVKGTVTVGVDGTGHDVKLFGCAAGAYMEWDESANLLEVRGATAAGPGHLKLTTGELTVACGDVLGKIEFQAPAETGADALRISASIAAVAQVAFDATNNATDLVFYTGHSEDAAEKFRFTSQGEIGIGGANYGNDGQVLTSGGAGAAAAWECAGGGVGCGPLRISAGSNTAPAYSFCGDTDLGIYRIGTNAMGFAGNCGERIRFDMAGGGNRIGLGDSDPGGGTVMLGICQGANDDHVMAFYSSDVGHAHGGTGIANDQFARFKKYASDGGLHIRGFKDCGASPSHSLVLDGWLGEVPCENDTSGAYGVVVIRGRKGATSSCTAGQAVVQDEGNLWSADNHTTTRLIQKGSGDLEVTNTSLNALDDYPDALMGRVGRVAFSPEDSCLRRTCGHLLQERPDLIEAMKREKILIKEPCDPVPCGFIRVQKGITFAWDMAYQNWKQIDSQERRLESLETQIKALTEGK